MNKIIQQILLSTVIIITLDIGFMNLNKHLYSSTVINVQRVVMVPKYIGFVVAYICTVAILYWFILRQRRPIWEAMLLGVAVNGIYEGVNYSIFKNWSVEMAVIDTLWGGALLGTTTAIIYQLL